MPGWRDRVVGVCESLRDAEFQKRPTGACGLPLLLEDLANLLAGGRECDERVRKRLHICKLAVGDIPIGIAGPRRSVGEARAESPGIHECDLRALILSGGELSVGDEVAQGGLSTAVVFGAA